MTSRLTSCIFARLSTSREFVGYQVLLTGSATEYDYARAALGIIRDECVSDRRMSSDPGSYLYPIVLCSTSREDLLLLIASSPWFQAGAARNEAEAHEQPPP